MNKHLSPSPSFDRELVSLMPRMRHYARRLTRSSDAADDLVQMSLVRALRSQKQFTATDSEDLIKWLFTIIYTQFINIKRQEKRYNHKIQEYGEAISHDKTVPQAVTEAGVIAKDITNILNGVQKDHRDLMVDALINGPDYIEMAKRHNIPLGTVRSRLNRGRAKARELYQ